MVDLSSESYFEFLARACDDGHGKSCYLMGGIDQSSGKKSESFAHYNKACDTFYWPACFAWAKELELSEKYKEAKEWANKACENGAYNARL